MFTNMSKNCSNPLLKNGNIFKRCTIIMVYIFLNTISQEKSNFSSTLNNAAAKSFAVSV